MHTARLTMAAYLLGQVNLAYRRRHLVCHIRVRRSTTWVWGFLANLRNWGIIGHFELARLARRYRLNASQQYTYVRIYLRYVLARPAVTTWNLFTAPSTAGRVTLRTLEHTAISTNGAGIVLYTNFGWLTLTECLARKCGGYFLMGFTVS